MELLRAFVENWTDVPGWHPLGNPDDRLVQLASAGLPNRQTRSAMHLREIEEALGVLEALVVDVRRWRSCHRPAESRERREGIVNAWNKAINDNGWKTLAPLCEGCGVPVFLRQPERLGDGNVDPSTVCSERCRNRRKARESARRNK